MAKQTLMWTALPNGLTEDGRGLRVSLLMSPRLEPGLPGAQLGELGQFYPDFERWPELLASGKTRYTLRFGTKSVSIAGDQTTGESRIDTRYLDDGIGWGDSGVWSRLFKKTTPVRGFSYPDLSALRVLSYDTVAVHGLVQGLYTQLATQADDELPRIGGYLGTDSPWRGLIDTVREIDSPRNVNEKTGLRKIGQQFREFPRNMPQRKHAAMELPRFNLFHTPTAKVQENFRRKRKDDDRITASWVEYQKSALPKPQDFSKIIDFHQIVAAMNSYPSLLRKLGLVVDLIVDRRALGKTLTSFKLGVDVELPPTGGATRLASVNPLTQVRLGASEWIARPKTSVAEGESRVKNGLLQLQAERFDLLQADVDAAGFKLMNFARSLSRYDARPELRYDPTRLTENGAGVPALRNAGLMLVHRARDRMLENRIKDQAQKNAAMQSPQQTPAELWAEDLVRGYRVDIWDSKTGVWRSLCERLARYEVGGAALPDVREEGVVRLAATRPIEPTTDTRDLMKLHEAVMSWTGWSLAAPQPGLAIDPADKVDSASGDQTQAELPPGIELRSSYRARPGSLPRLRYGREYWLRARTVDLAGNSLAPSEQDIADESPRDHVRTYLRYEPVLPPVVALVKPAADTEVLKPLEGESMERIAIRSFNDTPELNLVPSTQTAERFALPVQTSIREAELHGMLDTPQALDKARYTLLTTKDEHASTDNVTLNPLASPAQVVLPMQGPTDPTPVDTVFSVLTTGKALSFLPDPMAREVVARFFGLAGTPPALRIRIPLYPQGTQWPDAQPFRVVCREQAAPLPQPFFDEAQRALIVPLPKSARVRLRLSLTLAEEDAKRLGVLRWLFDSPAYQAMSSGVRTKLRQRIFGGQHWMLTPWRDLELVHAVQRPLLPPQAVKQSGKPMFLVDRNLGATHAVPRFIALTHIGSTERLDLMAQWHEPRAHTADGSRDVPRHDRAYSVRLMPQGEYDYDSPLGAQMQALELKPNLIAVPPFGTANRFNVPVPAGVDERRHGHEQVHEFRDTRYRRIEYWLTGTTRFREYLPKNLLVDGGGKATEQHINLLGPRVVQWIPNSAPPPVPKVLYVVPTFGWSDSVSGQRKTRTRRGGGLRVYLDGPWNASGYGEMLAVVLPRDSFAGDPNSEPAESPLKTLVTQWGNDPIWDSAFVAGPAPKRTQFPLQRLAPDTGGAWLPPGAVKSDDWNEADQPPGDFRVAALYPPGVSNAQATVDVSPHDVFFDAERQLWYCDIELNPGAAYYPFVRLALARYQPCSVNGAHLSPVVLADFMALTPDRSVSISPGDDASSRRVSVYGSRPRRSAGSAEALARKSRSATYGGKAYIEQTVSIAETTVIEVWVERLDPDKGEDFGWTRVYDATLQLATAQAATTTTSASKTKNVRSAAAKKATTKATSKLSTQRAPVQRVPGGVLVEELQWFRTPMWEGSVRLPSSNIIGAKYRIVVAEYEEYLTDDAPTPAFPDADYNDIAASKGRRLVFVEHLPF